MFYNVAIATAVPLLLPTSRFITLLLLLLRYCYFCVSATANVTFYNFATATANFTLYNCATPTAVLLLLL
jgi:hypothetical protein